MKENLKDILTNLRADVDQDTLLKYLEGKLSAQDQHKVEKHALDDAFDADALEGLQGLENKKKIGTLVEQLNKDLHAKTKKKKRRKLPTVKLDFWVLIAVLLILTLAVIGYFLIHKMQAR